MPPICESSNSPPTIASSPPLSPQKGSGAWFRSRFWRRLRKWPKTLAPTTACMLRTSPLLRPSLPRLLLSLSSPSSPHLPFLTSLLPCSVHPFQDCDNSCIAIAKEHRCVFHGVSFLVSASVRPTHAQSMSLSPPTSSLTLW